MRRFGSSLGVCVLLACGSSSGGDDGSDEAEEATGESGESGDSGDTGEGVAGCEGTTLLAQDGEDPSANGAWAVGARSVVIDGMTAEVWYPAEPGSEAGAEPKTYSFDYALPPSEQGKIPDAELPMQTCDCYDGLPIDATHGPYPLVVFVHGTAGVRTQSLEITRHWASRGFVVVSVDHPGLWLHDLIASLCGGENVAQELAGDVEAEIAAVEAATGDLEFLAGVVDTTRVAVSGHSAGGGAAAGFGDRAQVLMPLSSGGVSAGSALQSTLVLGALEDTVVDWGGTVMGFESSPSPKRLVGVSPGGHLLPSSLCSIRNPSGLDLVEVGNTYDVCGLQLASFLFDCSDTYVEDPRGWDITNYATSATLEETLHCQDRSGAFSAIQTVFPEVVDFREE